MKTWTPKLSKRQMEIYNSNDPLVINCISRKARRLLKASKQFHGKSASAFIISEYTKP